MQELIDSIPFSWFVSSWHQWIVNDIWLWISTEPKDKGIMGISVSLKRNMFFWKKESPLLVKEFWIVKVSLKTAIVIWQPSLMRSILTGIFVNSALDINPPALVQQMQWGLMKLIPEMQILSGTMVSSMCLQITSMNQYLQRYGYCETIIHIVIE